MPRAILSGPIISRRGTHTHTSLPATTEPSQLVGGGSRSQGGIRVGGPRPGGWEQTSTPRTFLARSLPHRISPHTKNHSPQQPEKEVRDSPSPPRQRRAGKKNARRRGRRASQSMYSNLKSRRRAAQSAVPIYPAAAATPLFCVLCTQWVYSCPNIES